MADQNAATCGLWFQFSHIGKTFEASSNWYRKQDSQTTAIQAMVNFFIGINSIKECLWTTLHWRYHIHCLEDLCINLNKFSKNHRIFKTITKDKKNYTSLSISVHQFEMNWILQQDHEYGYFKKQKMSMGIRCQPDPKGSSFTRLAKLWPTS